MGGLVEQGKQIRRRLRNRAGVGAIADLRDLRLNVPLHADLHPDAIATERVDVLSRCVMSGKLADVAGMSETLQDDVTVEPSHAATVAHEARSINS